jgi:D-beta-D-heptose 7-phosphate kinase/D-beta-D-heptose 1-phosphate adenosyltransferase
LNAYHLSPDRLDALLNAFEGRKILVMGDLMLDEYLWGTVSRISPEAPVMVVEVNRTSHCLGGAGNVATNVQAMGGAAILSGVAGKDAMGEILREHAVACGSSATGIIAADERPTTVKTRIVAHSQQVVRVDRETRAPLDPASESRLLSFLRETAAGADAIILSDYAKGTLTNALVEEAVAQANRLGIPLAANLKPPRVRPFSGARFLSLNLMEAERAGNEPIADEAALARVGARLRGELACTSLLITRGSEGVALFTASEEPVAIPARRVEVYDVAGAGDAVISAAAMALAAGAQPAEAAAIGNLAGNVKVTKLGVAPVSRHEIRQMALSELR